MCGFCLFDFFCFNVYLNVFPVTDEPEEDLAGEGRVPEEEGISQGREPSQPETRVYETDEYVPDESGEDGMPIPSALPDLLSPQESGGTETSPQAESLPETESGQGEETTGESTSGSGEGSTSAGE